MPIKKKRSEKKEQNGGIPLYTPLKESIEKSGVDSATAGQTSWLFVSLLLSVGMSGIYLGIVSIFNLQFPYPLSHNPFFVNGFLFVTFILHFCIVMLRLKYLLVNVIFFCATYIILVFFGLRNIYLLLSIGFLLFIIYMLIPIYSWRIKVLDGILYFIYAIAAWLLTYS